MSANCLACDNGNRLPNGWKCDVCGRTTHDSRPAPCSPAPFAHGETVEHLGTKWLVWEEKVDGHVLLYNLFGAVTAMHHKYLTKIEAQENQ